MSRASDTLTPFESNARTVLEASVARVDARTRSRLNQARQAALGAVAVRRRSGWSATLVPAAGAAAAAVVALLLWHREPVVPEAPSAQNSEMHTTAVEDMDLLADGEALELIEGWDGPFYEWAADQQDENGESS